jgi:hypothetical protein
MLTTQFRIWLQDPNIPPVWTGVKLVDWPQYVKEGCIEVTVEGNGSDPGQPDQKDGMGKKTGQICRRAGTLW